MDMARKLTEQEELEAAAKLLRLTSAKDRDDILKEAGLNSEDRAQLSEEVGFEGDL